MTEARISSWTQAARAIKEDCLAFKNDVMPFLSAASSVPNRRAGGASGPGTYVPTKKSPLSRALFAKLLADAFFFTLRYAKV